MERVCCMSQPRSEAMADYWRAVIHGTFPRGISYDGDLYSSSFRVLRLCHGSALTFFFWTECFDILTMKSWWRGLVPSKLGIVFGFFSMGFVLRCSMVRIHPSGNISHLEQTNSFRNKLIGSSRWLKLNIFKPEGVQAAHPSQTSPKAGCARASAITTHQNIKSLLNSLIHPPS